MEMEGFNRPYDAFDLWYVPYNLQVTAPGEFPANSAQRRDKAQPERCNFDQRSRIWYARLFAHLLRV